jgi:hypothetical protein
MPQGTRLTVGHFAMEVQKARKALHRALVQEGVAVPPQVKSALDAANNAMKEYQAAVQREESAKEKRNAII